MSTLGTVGSINILFNVQFQNAERGLNRVASAAQNTGMKVKGAVTGIDRSVVSMNRAMASIRGREFHTLSLSALRASNSVDRLRGVLLAFSSLGGGLAAAFSVKGVIDYADAYKTVSNRLRVVKTEAESLSGLEQNIFDVAQRSRAQYQATGVLYSRIAQSAKKLNLTQKDTLRVTETIQKAFVVGGSNPVESAQSAIQLSQAIAANRLQGDELRTILENPALGQLLADQIAGGDIAKLREMAKEGELTAKVVLDAFKNASGEIDRLFNSTSQTIGQALILVDNALLKYVGTNEQVAKGTGLTISLLNALADNMDTVGSAVGTLAAVMLASFGKRSVGGIVAMTAEVVRQNAAIRANALAARDAASVAVTDAYIRRQAALTGLTAAMNNNNLTAKQVARAQKEAVAAGLQLVNAQNQLRTTSAASAAALASTGRAATVAGVAMRGFTVALGLVGGPFNAVLLALGVAMFVVSQQSATAKEAVDYYAEAITAAGGASQASAAGILEAVYALDSVANAANNAATLANISDATGRMEENFDNAASAAENFGSIAAQVGDRVGVDLAAKIMNLIETNREGEISFVDLRAELDNLAAQNPSFAGIINGIINVAAAANAARGEINALNAALAGDVGGFRSDIRKDAKGDFPGKVTGAENFFDGPGARARFYGDKFEDLKSNLAASKKSLGGGGGGGRRRGRRGGGGGGGGGGGQSDAAKAAENLTKRLQELDDKIQTNGFDKLDRDTIEMARSAGVADSQIKAFINSVKSGGQATGVMEQLRSKLQEVADVEFAEKIKDLHNDGTIALMSELDQKVISTAKSMGLAESQIQAFIDSGGNLAGMPVQFAQIATELERISQNERLSQFAGDLASAFGDFAKAAVSGTESFQEALGNLAKKIADLIFQLLVIDPLTKGLKNLFSSGGGGGLFSLFFHEGGTVGANDNKKVLIRHGGGGTNARSGVKHNEVMALLQKNETVFTKSQTDGIASALSSSGGTIRKMEPAQQNLSISVDDDGKITTLMNRTGIQAAKAGSAQAQKQMVRRLPAINRGYQQYGKVV